MMTQADAVWSAAIEAAAKECERHAEFCHQQAHGGGDFEHLITRQKEALYNALRIRSLKRPGPQQGGTASPRMDKSWQA